MACGSFHELPENVSRENQRFILFHGKQHTSVLGAPELEAYLTDLAVRGKVGAAIQNQAQA